MINLSYNDASALSFILLLKVLFRSYSSLTFNDKVKYPTFVNNEKSSNCEVLFDTTSHPTSISHPSGLN